MDKLLSLCMIVKNEEKVLERCLTSAQNFVDEMIIVDTGSTDRTKDIASRFTDRIYDFTWINDFAIAKNHAIQRATAKWVLVLDADEYLDPGQAEELRAHLTALDASQPLAFMVPILNCVESVTSGKFIESSAVRLFANLPTIFFDKPIHEQLVYRNGELPLRTYPLTVFHTGYLEEVRAEKQKSARNLQIFKNLKGKLTEYDYFTLGNEYVILKDFKKAVYYYERALTKRTETTTIFPYCRYQLTLALMELKRYKDALSVIDGNLAYWPQYPDYYSLKATIYETLGLEHEAIALYEMALVKAADTNWENQRFWLITPGLGSQIPLSNLANLHARNHNQPQAVASLAKLAHINPNDHLSLLRLLSILIQRELPDAILSLLGKLFDFNRTDHLIRLLHVSLLLGSRELSQHFHDACMRKQVAMQPLQHLYYAVLFDEQERFTRYVYDSELDQTMEQRNKLIFVASAIWNEPAYAGALAAPANSADTNLSMLRNLHAALFASDGNDDNRSIDLSYLSSLLIELFKLGRFDVYDRLLERYSSYQYALANMIGSYFYQNNQLQLAADYYSVLLQENQLTGPGYYQLARLYLHQGDTTEGLQFLKTAIERCPQMDSWYILYLSNSPQSPERQAIAQQYQEKFYAYSGINAVKAIIKDPA